MFYCTEITTPLPIAALLLRARNAKSAKERHDLAYFGWEASVRLAVAAKPPADRARLAMPSTGDWVTALDADDRIFDQPELLAVHELFSTEGLGQASSPRSTTVPRLLAGLPAYRNAILGHGAVREPAFYESAGDILTAGLEALWASSALWPEDARLVCIESVELDAAGTHRARILELSGTAARVRDPRGSEVPTSVVPKRLYMLAGDSYRPLHPWLLFEAAELRERVLFFNGRGRNARYLDYVGGEQLKGKALVSAWPTIEADLDGATLGHTPEETSETKDASLFGDYQLLGKLGEGGMGIVMLARQSSLGRLVALKRMPRGSSDDPIAIARFRREIAALARCEHPNVVKILAAGDVEGQLYYAMEVVDGADLADLSRALDSGADFDSAISSASARGREARAGDSRPSMPVIKRATTGAALPERATDRIEALAVMMRDAANALAHLHDNGIIHRDIKPANLMVTNERRVVIMDLGLAAIGDASKSITRDKHSILGTLRYLPPEQLQRSLLSLDRRADIYSLGATFYELMTGKPFFDGDSEARLIEQVLRQNPVEPRAANPSVPRDLALILTKATDKDPKLRYDDALALARDLDAYLEGRPIAARPPSIGYLMKLAIRRNRALAATIMLAILLAAGGAAWSFVRERRLRGEAEQARDEARASKARTEHMLAENLVEQAREALLDHHARTAANLLAQAYEMLPDDPVVRFLAAHAARSFVSPRNTLQHDQFVRSVAFSADGRQVVTASNDHTARVWDTTTGAALVTLKGHTDDVFTASFSPDGSRIVTASTDNTARLWDPKLGTTLAMLDAHTKPVRYAVFSPDGRLIITAGEDGVAWVWDGRTGARIRSLAKHTTEIWSVAFSPDSQRAVTTSSDGTAYIWDANTSTVIATIEKQEKGVRSAQFSPDGKRVVTAGDDATARVFDSATGKELLELSGHVEYLFSAAFNNDGTRIVTAGADATPRIWDAQTGRLITVLAGHTGGVLFAGFSPDGRTVLTASADYTARLWDVRSGTQVAMLDVHTGDVWDAAFDPSGHLVATASRDGTARLWLSDGGDRPKLLAEHGGSIRSVAFSPDGQRILTASADKTVSIRDAATGTQIVPLAQHPEPVRSAAFSRDGKQVATADESKTIRIFDAATGQVLHTWVQRTDVWSVAFSPDGRQLVIASAGTSNDGTSAEKIEPTAIILDVATGNVVRELRGHTAPVTAAQFSPDGLRIVTASADDTARLWDAKTGQEQAVLKGHTHFVLSASFSADGKLVVTSGGDKTLRLWDAQTHKLLRELEGHEKQVRSATFSPDGKWIATGSADRTSRIWDVASGKQLASLAGQADTVNCVAFSPDGRRLVTGSLDKTALVWDVGLETRSPQQFAASYRSAH